VYAHPPRTFGPPPSPCSQPSARYTRHGLRPVPLCPKKSQKSRPRRHTRPRAALLTSDATPQNMLYSCARRPPKGKEVGKRGGLEGEGGALVVRLFCRFGSGRFPFLQLYCTLCQIYSSPAPARASSALSCSVKFFLGTAGVFVLVIVVVSVIDTNRSARERSVGVERSRPRPHAM
jgi:hypothetical protein